MPRSSSLRAPLRASLLALALLSAATGCRRYTSVPIKGRLVSITPKEVVVEVEAKPGMRVVQGTYVGDGKGEVVGASGTVRISVPRKTWKNFSGGYVQIAAEKKGLLGREGGSTEVPLDATFKQLLSIPTDQDPWCAVVAGAPGNAKDGALHVDIDGEDAKIPAFIADDADGMKLIVATPGGAEIEVFGETIKAKKTGLTAIEVPTKAVILGIATDGLTGRIVRSKVKLKVTKDDESSETTVKMSLERTRALKMLIPQLRGVAKGKTVPDALGKVTDSVLLVTYDDELMQVGPDTTAGTARWIAIEHDTERKLSTCVYTSFSKTPVYHDVSVKVYEARTGKEVAKSDFAIEGGFTCPEYAMSNDSFAYRPKLEETTDWLKKMMKSNWK